MDFESRNHKFKDLFQVILNLKLLFFHLKSGRFISYIHMEKNAKENVILAVFRRMDLYLKRIISSKSCIFMSLFSTIETESVRSR